MKEDVLHLNALSFDSPVSFCEYVKENLTDKIIAFFNEHTKTRIRII